MPDTFHVADALGRECFDLISGDMWTDIACALYLFISDSISNEAQFVAAYLDSGEEKTDNPNRPIYAQFEESVYRLVMEDSDPSYPSDELLALIQSDLELVKLVPYEDEAECALGLLFQLIKVIDRVIGDTKSSIFRLSSRGPLNENNSERVGLYLKSTNHFIEDFFVNNSIKCRLDYGSINEQLTSFFFFKKEDGFELPRIVPSSSSIESLDSIKEIKVAISPFRGERIPFLNTQSKGHDIWFEYKAGSAFCCAYSDAYGEGLSNQLRAIIEKAIRANCIMLVLPEFVVNDKTLEATKQAIKQMGDLGSLQLVVAGSWWDAAEQNNVGALILAESQYICRFDKYVPYEKAGKKRYAEILDKPAKRTVFVSVPGVGLVLPQICRDAVEQDIRLETLVKAFRPAAIAVSAWSNSIWGAFEPSLSYMAAKYNPVCFVANACGARRDSLQEEEKAPAISLCVTPDVECGSNASRKSTRACWEYMTVDCMDECSLSCSNVWICDVACGSYVDEHGKDRPLISTKNDFC